MKRLLIIAPHFAPINAPDGQRVRLALPYLRENGWQAELLAVDAECVAGSKDQWLTEGLPADVPVHRVQALGLGWSRVPGLGSLTFRALGALRRKGDELLKSDRFDLVYFSTTQFGVHVLGPRWKRKFGVPFVMDYQDPWVSDYYRTHPEVTPPGGRLKYAVADWLNRRQEPRVLRECAGITSVSPDYPRQLAERYEWLNIVQVDDASAEARPAMQAKLPAPQPNVSQHRIQSIVLPFPGDERDLERVKSDGVRQTIFSKEDGKMHWVYVGVCITQMHFALRGFFGALKSALATDTLLKDKLRLHFVGTSYAAGRGIKTVEPLAAEFGLSDIVEEHTERIPYAQALRCLLDADALIVPGSDDPGYTASKIYPYLLARKPLLAVFHENSSVVGLIRRVQGGTMVAFQSGDRVEALAGRIQQSWFDLAQYSQIVELDRRGFEPHTAPAQAKVLTEFFQSVIGRQANMVR